MTDAATYQTDVWHDITISVAQAPDTRLDLLSETDLTRRSDALLASMPDGGATRPRTTTLVLRRYQPELRRALCRGDQPRAMGGAVEDELRELTRAVLLTIGLREGVSVQAAVGIALVLYRKGLGAFCALPGGRTA